MPNKRFSFTTEFKLKVLEMAENTNNRVAAREYDISEANIRLWRKNKEKLSIQGKQAKAAGRGRKAQYPELEQQLLNYIMERQAGGFAIDTGEVRLKALHMMKQINADTNFKASMKWCYMFMKRNDIPNQRRTSTQQLPADSDDKLLDYHGAAEGQTTPLMCVVQINSS